ncbi:MAG: hypothetical protein ABJA76_22690 [Mucilaginibacter sp.]
MIKTVINIIHYLDGDVHTFDVTAVSDEVLIQVINVLKWEIPLRSMRACDKSFKDERALQHERHMIKCQENQENPKQIFIDFPI